MVWLPLKKLDKQAPMTSNFKKNLRICYNLITTQEFKKK